MSYDYDNYEEMPYERIAEADREELEAIKVASRERHDYREIMYKKEDVAEVEKKAIAEILLKNPNLSTYPDPFIQKALTYFPEQFQDFSRKTKRGKKSNIYFLETVGRHLWEKWNNDKSDENQNNFILYLCPIIDGVIFKYGRHKHGLSYGEVFQGAIVKLIQSMPSFDPKRPVKKKIGEDETGLPIYVEETDDNGNPIYARVYTYFTMSLNFGITTMTMSHGKEKNHTISYDDIMGSYGVEDSATDAPMIYQEFLIYLNSYRELDHLTKIDKKILNSLYELLTTTNNFAGISNNIVYTLQTECKVTAKEVNETLAKLAKDFGPLTIFSSTLCRTKLSDAEAVCARQFEN